MMIFTTVPFTVSVKFPFDGLYKKYFNVLVRRDNSQFESVDRTITITDNVAVVELTEDDVPENNATVDVRYFDNKRGKKFSYRVMYRVVV